MKKGSLILFLLLLFPIQYLFAQTGLSVSPPRMYYEVEVGKTGDNSLLITNMSDKSSLELSISTGDWQYNSEGDNMMLSAGSLKNSCAAWISTGNTEYIHLKPKESRSIDVNLTVPSQLSDSIPVYTAMLYVTQMNPTDQVNAKGAQFKVSVRSAVKIYYRRPTPRLKKINIQGFSLNKEERLLKMTFQNEGNVWTEGTINTDILNSSTGKEIKLKEQIFYTLPNDLRHIYIPLPKDLEAGTYVATSLVDYNDTDNIEAAELQFVYE